MQLEIRNRFSGVVQFVARLRAKFKRPCHDADLEAAIERLSGVDVASVDLSGASIKDANLAGARLQDAHISFSKE